MQGFPIDERASIAFELSLGRDSASSKIAYFLIDLLARFFSAAAAPPLPLSPTRARSVDERPLTQKSCSVWPRPSLAGCMDTLLLLDIRSFVRSFVRSFGWPS